MWINNFTGEVYRNITHMVVTIISDMVKCKACRTLKMLDVCRYERKDYE